MEAIAITHKIDFMGDEVISPEKAKLILTTKYKLPDDVWDCVLAADNNGFHLPQALVLIARHKTPPNKALGVILWREVYSKLLDENEA
jgi:hypothetical protein